MVISEFKGKTVFLDTAPLIYFIEGHSQFQSVLAALFLANDKGEFLFTTSVITLLEVLVQPIRMQRDDIAAQYRKILIEAEGVVLFDIDERIAAAAAMLRAKHNIRTPDSLQLATAIESGADMFLTNDLRLKGISNLPIITPSELKIN